MSLADELSRIADEAARTRHRLEELSRACAELRKQLAPEEKPKAGDDVQAQRFQSVS
jgi:BMFP domain-containing protein YqiC